MRRFALLAALLVAACDTAPLPPLKDAGPADEVDADDLDGAADLDAAEDDAEEQTWDTCAGTGPRDVMPSDVKLTGDSVALVDNDVWVQVPPSEDPWACLVHEATDVCEPGEFGPYPEADGVWFDVETVACNWFTGRQTTLADVPAGALVIVRIWHFQITYGEGDFTLALAIGDQARPLWDVARPVPSTAGLIYERFHVPYAIPAGTPIWYHLSNHGANSWGLIEISTHPGDAP